MFGYGAFWDFNYSWSLWKEKEGLENPHWVGSAEEAKGVSTVSPSGGGEGKGSLRELKGRSGHQCQVGGESSGEGCQSGR